MQTMSRLYETFCTCYLWLWLVPPLTTCYVICTLATGFVDDVMYVCNGPYGVRPMGRVLKRLQSDSPRSSTEAKVMTSTIAVFKFEIAQLDSELELYLAKRSQM